MHILHLNKSFTVDLLDPKFQGLCGLYFCRALFSKLNIVVSIKVTQNQFVWISLETVKALLDKIVLKPISSLELS